MECKYIDLHSPLAAAIYLAKATLGRLLKQLAKFAYPSGSDQIQVSIQIGFPRSKAGTSYRYVVIWYASQKFS